MHGGVIRTTHDGQAGRNGRGLRSPREGSPCTHMHTRMHMHNHMHMDMHTNMEARMPA